VEELENQTEEDREERVKLQNELRAVQQKQLAILEARKIMSPREKEVEKGSSQQSESVAQEVETSNQIVEIMKLREEYEQLSRDYQEACRTKHEVEEKF
jgi:hypothetical protein